MAIPIQEGYLKLVGQAAMTEVSDQDTMEGVDPEDREDTVNSVLAVRVTEFGGYDKLKVQRVEIPAHPSSGEVEVRVMVCGLNFADLYCRQGLMKDKKPPFTLGMECSGEVTQVASNVTKFKKGDRVACYRYSGGLLQETIMISEKCCFKMPERMSYDHGAAILVNYLTAYFCVNDIGNLKSGQSMLVHSCVGGVGWACTQMAKVRGDITIYGTCSSKPGKAAAAKENGVTHVLAPQLYEQELRVLAPNGVHLVVDSIGGANFARSQKLLKPLGRVVLTGASGILRNERRLGLLDSICMWWKTRNVSPTNLVMKSQIVAGLHLANLLADDPIRVRAAVVHIFAMVLEGKLEPRIDSVHTFDKIVDATKVLQERRNIGKVLLTPHAR